MNEQEARTIAAQATGTLIAQYAEAVQFGGDWVVVVELQELPSDRSATTHQIFAREEEWRAAAYMKHAMKFLNAHIIYSPSQKIAVLYIDGRPANTNTLHFDAIPTRKEIAAWVEIYLNGRLNSVLADMYASGITELTA